MNRVCLLAVIVVSAALFSPTPAYAGNKSHPLDEDAALSLLLHRLKTDHVYDQRIPLKCVTFETEEKTNTFFQFVLRENHRGDCGGDPDVSPVVDRYRIHRAFKKIERYDPVNDNWQAL